MTAESHLDILFLNESDMLAAGVRDMPACIATIERAFELISAGDYVMGGAKGDDHGLKIKFPKTSPFPNMPLDGPDRRFMSIISYLGGEFHVCGDKWYGSNLANKERGLPRSILMLTLNDPDTGAPFAYMSANLLSAMRTGAVPGVAAKHLAKSGSNTVGVIGAGVINRYCTEAIVTALPEVDEVVIYDLFPEVAARVAQQLGAELGVPTRTVDSLEACLAAATVITVAASGETKPHLDQSRLQPGTLVLLTGEASFSPGFLRKTPLFADLWAMHRRWILTDGFYDDSDGPDAENMNALHPDHFDDSVVTDLGDVVTGRAPGRQNDDDVIVFVAGGLPMEDAAWGKAVYERAREGGIGQRLTLWDAPHSA